MPPHVPSQVERYLQAVRRHLPALGEVSGDRNVLIIFDKAVEYHSADIAGRGVRSKYRDQCTGIADRTYNDGVAVRDALVAGYIAGDRYRKKYR